MDLKEDVSARTLIKFLSTSPSRHASFNRAVTALADMSTLDCFGRLIHSYVVLATSAKLAAVSVKVNKFQRFFHHF